MISWLGKSFPGLGNHFLAWEIISWLGKSFPGLGNHFLAWEIISWLGKSFPGLGNHFRRWENDFLALGKINETLGKVFGAQNRNMQLYKSRSAHRLGFYGLICTFGGDLAADFDAVFIWVRT